MSFPPYPKYKDSGVEWLGEMPEHWENVRLKHLSRAPIQNGVGAPSDTDVPEYPRYVRITDLAGPRELRDDTFRSLPPEVAEDASFEVGDLLLACVGATFAKSYLHTLDIGPVCYAGYLVKVSPSHRARGDFIAYWTESAHYWAQANSRVIQSTVQNFSAAKFRDLQLILPPLPEQHAIAAFLDRETAKIDALIAEQRRLIELLKEKRQAVISHAVTKGLNPNAPMKDSGIEWLGEVPEHWEVIKFGHLVRESPCYGVLVPDHDDDGIPMLRITDMEKGRAVKDDLNKISPGLSAQYSRTIVAVGDIALSVVGTIGEALIVDEELAGVNLSRAVARIQVNDRIHASYATTVFASSSFTRYIDLVCVGTAQRVLNMSDLVDFRLALPPVDEQSLIQRYVHSATVRLNVLLDEAEQSITLLQERRSALISAAVTGRIDVRGAVDSGDAA